MSVHSQVRGHFEGFRLGATRRANLKVETGKIPDHYGRLTGRPLE